MPRKEDPEQRSDQDWVEELLGKRGEARQTEAWEDLAQEMHKWVFNQLYSQRDKGNPMLVGYSNQQLGEVARDYVQSALLRIYEKIHLYSGAGRFLAWARVVTSRVVWGILRRQRNNTVPLATSDVEDEEERQERAVELEATEPEPEEDALLKERGAVLEQAEKMVFKCLEQLAEKRRAAFLGRLEGKSSKDMADEEEGASENAVNGRVHQAKKDLRNCLRKNGIDEDILDLL
jgi:RNA polymerase sigma factor (sigma-70 family)